MRKAKPITKIKTAIISTILFLCLCISGCTQTANIPTADASEQAASLSAGEMTVNFIDVGQGDATLIQCDGESMLVDAGPNDQGLSLWNYLQKHNATDLKYVIGTHPDADHIGGMDVILYRCNVDMVIMPSLTKDTKTYDDVVQTMQQKNLTRTNPVQGVTYHLGSATFTIVGPTKEYDEDDANDWSVSIVVQNGSDKFLLVGDAESQSEHDMLSNGSLLSADVYKVAHHGSNTGTTDEFLNAVNPTYAVISCGKNNKYGHPHQEVLDKLAKRNILVFRTDTQGTIIATSNGNGITWSTGETPTIQKVEQTNEDFNNTQSDSMSLTGTNQTASATSEITYILNTTTLKFHLPNCEYAQKISSELPATYAYAQKWGLPASQAEYLAKAVVALPPDIAVSTGLSVRAVPALHSKQTAMLPEKYVSLRLRY